MSQRSYDLLPSNATAEERKISLAARFSDALLPEDIRALWNPDNIPLAFMPFLAWALHIDYWDDALPEETKRTTLKRAFEWHRYKGTPWAVRKALEDLGFSGVQVREWMDIGAKPYTFALTLRPFEEERFAKAKKVAFEYKNARSHLTEIVGKMNYSEGLEATDNAVIKRKKILGDVYPWPENLYGSVYAAGIDYLGYGDKMAAKYGVFEEAEKITQVVRLHFVDYMFVQHHYGEPGSPEIYYDGSVEYNTDAALIEKLVMTQSDAERLTEAMTTQETMGVTIKWIL